MAYETVRNPFRFDHTTRWRPPYPAGEHEARVICGDPVALALDELQCFLAAKDLRYPIALEVAVDCLWHQVHDDHMSRYEIMRNAEHFPEMLPDELYRRLTSVLFGKE